MQTLIVEVDSPSKAKELTSILSSMDFVKKIRSTKNTKQMIAALQEKEIIKTSILKRQNKAIAKYL